MKCQNCGKNDVNVHLRQSINGQVTEYALCSQCAEQLGVGGMFADFGSFGGFGGMGLMGGFEPFAGLESLLGGMFGGTKTKTLPQITRCKLCGSTFEDISKRGKVGCAECYDLFADRLTPSIERIHNRTKHAGKLPGRPAAQKAPMPAEQKKAAPAPERAESKTAAPQETLESLRAQLKAAVAAEEYEKAAVLRDRIKEMESK